MATALAPSPVLRTTRNHEDLAGPVTASVVVHLLMLAGYIAGYHGDISTLVCADSTSIGRFPFEAITYGFGTGGYDGQFYYALAHDPWHKDVTGVIDFQAYRHGRILYPALAWLVSGGGDPVLLMWALPAINLAAIGVLAWLGATLAKSYGRSTWLGFLLPLVLNMGPPAMRNLTDPLAATALAGVVVGSLLGWRAVWLGLWATAALLSREQTVLIVVAVLVSSWIAGRWPLAAAMAAALGVWFAWLGVLYDYYHELPFATNTLTAPFVGIWWRWTHLDGLEPQRRLVEDLGEHGLVGRLAVFLDDRARHPRAVLHQPAPQVVHDLGAALEAEGGPGRLRRASAIHELLHLRRVHVGHAGDRLAGGRVLNRDRRPLGRGSSVAFELRFRFDRGHRPPSLACCGEVESTWAQLKANMPPTQSWPWMWVPTKASPDTTAPLGASAVKKPPSPSKLGSSGTGLAPVGWVEVLRSVSGNCVLAGNSAACAVLELSIAVLSSLDATSISPTTEPSGGAAVGLPTRQASEKVNGPTFSTGTRCPTLAVKTPLLRTDWVFTDTALLAALFAFFANAT